MAHRLDWKQFSIKTKSFWFIYDFIMHIWLIDCHNYIYVDELMLRMVKLWSYPVDWSEEITELVSGWGFRFNADFVIGAWL